MGQIGTPSESELRCLANARLWKELIAFVALFEEPDEKSNDNLKGPVAHMVEQRLCKSQVAGSIPRRDLQKKKRLKPEYDWRVVIANAQGRR